jgi:hypothetical protein
LIGEIGTSPRRYPGEEIREAAGFPALVHVSEGRAGLPLVVIVPGAGHLARVAYGHPEGDPRDFVAHWLAERGHTVLSASYPLEHAVYESVHPDFGLRDWGRQVAELADGVVAERGLVREVIVLGWSMAGGVCLALTEAAGARGLAVRLFCGVAATSPLPLQSPGLLGALRAARRPSGMGSIDFYLGREPGLHSFLDDVAERSAWTRREIVSRERYLSEWIGHGPIGLWGSPIRSRGGAWVEDMGAALDDLGTVEYHLAPPIGLVMDDGPSDERHALADRAMWSPYLVTAVRRLVHGGADPRALGRRRWLRLRDLVLEAPERLSLTVPGNHFLLLGEPGARAVAEGVLELDRRLTEVRREAAEILGTTEADVPQSGP